MDNFVDKKQCVGHTVFLLHYGPHRYPDDKHPRYALNLILMFAPNSQDNIINIRLSKKINSSIIKAGSNRDGDSK